jgi:hypothetical protein
MFETGNSLAKRHGMAGKPIYVVWQRMKERCLKSDHKDFKNYGGRGIQLCKEWNSFVPFFEWAKAAGYERGLTLDRIDNDGDYSPSNCRWVTKAENNKNKRKRMIKVGGLSGDYQFWAKRLGCDPRRISLRISSGWSPERAVTQPVLPVGKGKTYESSFI